MLPNETSERKRIKEYWEESTPMSFLDKNLSYEEKKKISSFASRLHA
jgi:predicted ATP-dependent Lon-type protease